MSEYIPDNLDLYAAHEKEQQRRLEKLPVCEYCGETITDDHYYDLDGDIVCQECLDHNFRKRVEDFVE